MINILYYDREMIYKTLAESLVIGGLPMNKYKTTTERLTEEIKFCESVIKFLDVNKDKTIILKDENDREYLGVENIAAHIDGQLKKIGECLGVENVVVYIDEQLKKFGKYYRRGKALGLVKAGSGHNSMFKGVTFNMVIDFPLYWLKEYQRYHFTDIISSQSTMHKILEFNLDDMFTDEVDPRAIEIIKDLKEQYNLEQDKDKKKAIWRRLINTLPDGFHMSMGITMNYLQAISIVGQRKNHKLSEWRDDFVPFLLDLPLFKTFMIKDK